MKKEFSFLNCKRNPSKIPFCIKLATPLILLVNIQLNAKPVAITVKTEVVALSKSTFSIIKGSVKDENGLPIPSANVTIKGKPGGVTTDFDGNYSIDAQNGDVIVISFIGYSSKEIIVGTNNTHVALSKLENVLSELVVVGYGTKKKNDLTGSVGVVHMEDLKSRPLTNAGQTLQGTVSGVFALQNSGKPGGDGVNINIRGLGTLNNADPLVLVDGFPGSLNDVNPSDIKSVSVLKDAASAAIYGNRAANGVILITTIKGTAGKLNISYNTYYGTQRATALPQVLNSVQYTTLYNEAQANSGITVPKYSAADIAKYAAHNDINYPDNNYFKIYYNDASILNHRFNLTGGSENIKYAFMAGHLEQGGILVGGGYNKSDFRSNVDAYLLTDKKLRVSVNLSGNKSYQTEPRDEWNTKWYATTAPVYPLTNAAGQWVGIDGGNNFYGETKTGSTSKINRYAVNAQLDVEYKIYKDLSAQITYGYGLVSSNTNAFHANVLIANSAGATKTLTSDLSVTDGRDTQTLLTSLLKYNKKLGLHEIGALAGYSEETFDWSWNSGYRSGFLNNDQRILSLGDPSTQKNNAGASALGLKSFFGRLNYTYAGKYLVEGNVRKDGSSRFADGQRWGVFPSFSAGWVASKESFLKDIKGLNFLKFRASWGQLGNQNINSLYASVSTLSSGENYSFGNTLYPGVAIKDLTNKETTWETSTQTDFGVDATIFHDFDITFDYFDKKTTGILMQLPISTSLGNLGSPWQNVGAVANKGIEFSLGYKKTISEGFKVRSTIILTHIVNKVSDLAGASPIINGQKALVEGSAINSFYMLQKTGVYQISDFTWQNNSDPSIAYENRTWNLKPGEAKTSFYNAVPGDLKFKDLNGDGVIDNNDRSVTGKQFPDLNYSWNFNVEYKNFDLGVFFQGVAGIQGYTYYEVASEFSNFSNSGAWWMDRWTPSNPTNTMPRVTLDDARRNLHSTFYQENAAYLRLKNIELGYSLPKSVLSKANINSIRLYFNVQNAFTITKFKGFDPEQNTSELRAEAYPQTRIFTVGLNANF